MHCTVTSKNAERCKKFAADLSSETFSYATRGTNSIRAQRKEKNVL
jgi:hypothetical protein